MTVESQRDMQHLLRKVSDLVRNARPSDLDALMRGDARLAIVYKKQGKSSARTMADLDYDESWLQVVIDDLNKAATRVDGERVLRNARLRKAQLQRICRMMDVPYQSKDTVAALSELIIDSTIGVRLRSKAILGG